MKASKLKILIVEDDAASAKLQCLLLQQAGAVVKVALTAEDAIDIVPNFKPALITVDLFLPDMSGATFVENVKMIPGTKDIVFVAITSEGEKAKELGCAGHIRKPIDSDSFAKSIMAHVGA